VFADIRTQINVVAALTIRELQGLMKSYSYGFAWALLEPIIFIAILRVARSAIHGLTPPNMPPSTFIILGIIPFYTFSSTMTSVAKALSSPDTLLKFPRVTPIDVALASAVKDFCIHSTLFVLFVGFFSVYENAWPPENALKVAMTLVAIWLLGISFGLVFGTATRVFPPLKQFVSYYNFVNRMLGGMLFVITTLPSAVWPYFTWNPVLHCMEMMRDGWFITYRSPVASPAYVMEWLIGMFLLGLSLERFQRRVPYV
jgi:capsular polysaccharide transport system permease protein